MKEYHELRWPYRLMVLAMIAGSVFAISLSIYMIIITNIKNNVL